MPPPIEVSLSALVSSVQFQSSPVQKRVKFSWLMAGDIDRGMLAEFFSCGGGGLAPKGEGPPRNGVRGFLYFACLRNSYVFTEFLK